MNEINKSEIRAAIMKLKDQGLFKEAAKVWDLLDRYNELDLELTLKYTDTPAVQEIDNLVRASTQHSQIAGQTVSGCLSYYWDQAANRLLRCQNDPAPGIHLLHGHEIDYGDKAQISYTWDDAAACNLP